MKLILGGPRTSFAVPRASATGAPLGGAFEPASDTAHWGSVRSGDSAWPGPVAPPGGRERSGARLALGPTKEVLGFSIDLLAFNWDFLGSSYSIIDFLGFLY